MISQFPVSRFYPIISYSNSRSLLVLPIALNVCFQLGIGEVNSARENSSEFFLRLGASKEYSTNEETDQKEEHEHLPDDVNYHLVDEQCRKKSQELQPRADEQCRKKSHELSLRRDALYHQDYHEVKKC